MVEQKIQEQPEPSTPRMHHRDWRYLIPLGILVLALVGMLLYKNLAPDLTIGLAGTQGNSTGNLSMYGYVVQDGDWIYYCYIGEVDDKGNYIKTDKDAIYKMHLDGSQVTKISSDNGGSFNIVDGWLYYISNHSIYRIRTDGSDRTRLTTIKDNKYFLLAGGISVVDGWIYYTTCYIDEELVYVTHKLRIDGKELYTISNKTISDGTMVTAFYEGYMYYYRGDTNELGRMTTDGMEDQVISPDFYFLFSLNIEDGWVYVLGTQEISYSSIKGISPCLYKMRLDGSEMTRIAENVNSFNVSGDWIYYTKRENNSLCRMHLDGSNLQEIYPDFIGRYYITTDWIFFKEILNPVTAFQKMHLDGSNVQEVFS